MIGTHTTKLSNAKSKQDAVCADIIAGVDTRYITSSTIKLTKKYFACPRNAANMKTERTMAEIFNAKPKKIISLPDVQDARAVKQILLPITEQISDHYVNASPLESLGLLRELWLRCNKQKIKHKRLLLELIPSAFSNHGELMLEQAGRVAVIPRDVVDIAASTSPITALCLTTDVVNMNISAGFVATGHPAITAIGGMVHSLERCIDASIEFAIGLHPISWHGAIKGTNYFRNNTNAQKIKPNIINERTGSGQVVLLLRTNGDKYDALREAASKINRIAGGGTHKLSLEYLDNQLPPNASYLHSAIDQINPQDKDALDCALSILASSKDHLLSQVGYAWLEEPQNRKENIRANQYPHVWCEPIYSLVCQRPFTSKAWWQRVSSHQNKVVWN